jgi:hypothetical protein
MLRTVGFDDREVAVGLVHPYANQTEIVQNRGRFGRDGTETRLFASPTASGTLCGQRLSVHPGQEGAGPFEDLGNRRRVFPLLETLTTLFPFSRAQRGAGRILKASPSVFKPPDSKLQDQEEKAHMQRSEKNFPPLRKAK